MTPDELARAKSAAGKLWEIIRTADEKQTLPALLGLALEAAAVVIVAYRNDGRVTVVGQASPLAPSELDDEVARLGEIIRQALNGRVPS